MSTRQPRTRGRPCKGTLGCLLSAASLTLNLGLSPDSQDVHRLGTFLPSTRMTAFVSRPHLAFEKHPVSGSISNL